MTLAGSVVLFGLRAALFAVGATPPAEIEQVPGSTVYFALGSDFVEADERARLRALGAELLGDPRDVLLIGHSDRTGLSALNRELSRARAVAVGRVLLEAGIDEHRLELIGAGYGDPLDPAATPEADAVNRRVEIWMVGPDQVGWVSWRRRRLEAKTPEVPWFEARVKLPLEPEHRVRTVGDSAGEITFRRGHILYLGPNGSLVVFAPRNRPRRRGATRRDIHLEAGSLLARLPGEGPDLAVTTDGAQIDSASRNVRVEYRERRETSLVSVYDGRVEVAAQGAVVRVTRGYGTRVKKGQRPEPPSPLPPPPAWADEAPVVSFGSADLEWVKPSRGRVRLELTTWRDPAFVRPLTATVAAGARHRFRWLDPGAYRARLASVDEKGLTGFPGPEKPVYLLRPPLGARAGEGGLVLDAPGRMAAPELEGHQVSIRRRAAEPWASSVTLHRPGAQTAEIRLERAGVPPSVHEIRVEVAPLSLAVYEARDALVLRAVDASGLPVRDARLGAGPQRAEEPPCGPSTYPNLELLPCTGSLAALTPLEPVGTAQFRLPRPETRGFWVVRDLETGLGGSLFIEAAPEVSEVVPEPEVASSAAGGPEVLGVFVGVAGGAELRAVDRYAPSGLVELGLQVRLLDELDLRARLDAAFGRYRLDGEGSPTVTSIPASLGLDFAYAGGPWRPWAGFGFGAWLGRIEGGPDLAEPRPFPVASVGLGRALGDLLEVYLALRAGPTPLPVDVEAGNERSAIEWANLPSGWLGIRTLHTGR